MLYVILTLLVILLIAVVLSARWVAHYTKALLSRQEQSTALRDQEIKDIVWKVRLHLTEGIAFQQLLILSQDRLDIKIDELNSDLAEFREFAKSDMIVARQNELSRLRETENVLERIIRTTTSQRQEVATSDMLAMDSVKTRITELENILADRTI